MQKIGIIGNGFVGNSIAFGFSPTHEIRIHDKDKKRNMNTIEEVLDCDFIFVAVPTPMNSDGSINLDVVKSALTEVQTKNTKDNIIILKSTMVPGTVEKLQLDFPNLNIVFNPEFLTERTAKLDFLTQARIVLGGYPKHTAKVRELFEERFMHCYVIETDSTTAELIKYMNNVFFATKVSIMNEFKQVCDEVGANWDVALKGFAADQRIGDSHLNVPGPDGKLGFGGSCFPKDINAFIDFANKLDIDLHTVKGAWATNLEVRPEKDWEKLKGRAVVEQNNKQLKIWPEGSPLNYLTPSDYQMGN